MGHIKEVGILGHKYTVVKMGHIGKVWHIGAQIYICKSGGNELNDINEIIDYRPLLYTSPALVYELES